MHGIQPKCHSIYLGWVQLYGFNYKNIILHSRREEKLLSITTENKDTHINHLINLFQVNIFCLMKTRRKVSKVHFTVVDFACT